MRLRKVDCIKRSRCRVWNSSALISEILAIGSNLSVNELGVTQYLESPSAWIELTSIEATSPSSAYTSAGVVK